MFFVGLKSPAITLGFCLQLVIVGVKGPLDHVHHLRGDLRWIWTLGNCCNWVSKLDWFISGNQAARRSPLISSSHSPLHFQLLAATATHGLDCNFNFHIVAACWECFDKCNFVAASWIAASFLHTLLQLFKLQMHFVAANTDFLVIFCIKIAHISTAAIDQTASFLAAACM